MENILRCGRRVVVPHLLPAHPVDGGMMDHPKQVGALRGRVVEIAAAGGELEENVLQDIADRCFVPQQGHAMAEHRNDVLVVNALQFPC